MLMALRFEPIRFFLKGKVTQKQTSYKHKHTVRDGRRAKITNGETNNKVKQIQKHGR